MELFAILGWIVDDLNNTAFEFECYTDTETHSINVLCHYPHKVSKAIDMLLDDDIDSNYYIIQFDYNIDCNAWEVSKIQYDGGTQNVLQSVREHVKRIGMTDAYKQMCNNITAKADR